MAIIIFYNEMYFVIITRPLDAYLMTLFSMKSLYIIIEGVAQKQMLIQTGNKFIARITKRNVSFVENRDVLNEPCSTRF